MEQYTYNKPWLGIIVIFVVIGVPFLAWASSKVSQRWLDGRWTATIFVGSLLSLFSFAVLAAIVSLSN